MADFRICEVDEFLQKDDGMMSLDEYSLLHEPVIEPTIKMPEDYIYENSMIDKSERMVEGEITQMLRMTPGILPAIDQFPKSYKPSKVKLPDFLPNDRLNKIPVLLNEKYFHFDGKGNKSISTFINDLNGSGNDNGNSIGRARRCNQHGASGISSGSNRSNCSGETLKTRFCTVFADDSDEDNCNADSSLNSSTHQNADTTEQDEINEPHLMAQGNPFKYYNAREIYQMKRGNKLA